ncbi:MAG: dTDP-4-dehydrorhamnose reductase [Bacteroidales bacterium]|nr:dTDP-4-dehydrorhamnose reductase [Bacteroidales bacterium]
MKILITGANGQLGNEFKILTQQYPQFDFVFTDVEEMDITDEAAIASIVQQEKPDILINCAAYTAVDKAEKETALAYLINDTAVGNLARVCSRLNILLVHISTDYIFDGKGYRPYAENDPPHPLSIYAKSKFAGEEAVFANAKKALLIRTSWLYSEFGNNFVKTIMKYGKERGSMNIVFDQIGSPTYAYDLAKTILEILALQPAWEDIQVYHYSNEGVASWYDFAKAIIELSDIRCTIHAIETKDYPLPAIRPYFSVFNKAKIKQQFHLEIPYWRDSLIECLKRMKR